MRIRSFIACAGLAFVTACAQSAAPPVADISQAQGGSASEYSAPVHLGNIEHQDVVESSGIVASRSNAGLFWTHNDSGDGPFIYAFDGRGKRRGVWQVAGASAVDWEDIAAGPGPEKGRSYIYIGDIGDNGRTRKEIIVYRVAEPLINPNDAASTKRAPLSTEESVALRLSYPDSPHDAEALIVHPTTGDIYIITKVTGGAASVYKAASQQLKVGVNTLARVGTLSLPSVAGSMVTGADISPDGKRVVVCDYFGAYEMRLPEAAGEGFDQVWNSPLIAIYVGLRRQGEAICYRLDGAALLVTSEGSPCPLTEVTRSAR